MTGRHLLWTGVVLLVVLAGCGADTGTGVDDRYTNQSKNGESIGSQTGTTDATTTTNQTPEGDIVAFSELNSVEQEAFLQAVNGIYVHFNDGDNTYAEYFVRDFRDVDYIEYNDSYYAVNVGQSQGYTGTTYKVRRVSPSTTVTATDFANLSDVQKQVFLGALDEGGEYEYVTEGGRSTGVFGSEYVRYEGELYRVETGIIEDGVSSYTMSVERYQPSNSSSS